jgi:predicted permease
MTGAFLTIRRLRRSPGYVLAVVVSLGVGVAVCVAVFSLINVVVFDEIVGIRDRTSLIRVRWTTHGGPFTTAEFDEFERQLPSRLTSAAAQGERSLPALLPAGPALLTVAFVSARFFDTLGTRAVIGRLLSAADADARAAPVVVIAEELWLGAFNGDRDIVGRTMTIGSRTFTIVGVTPGTAPGLRQVDLGTSDQPLPQLWVNLTHARNWPATATTGAWLYVAGRLADKATLTDARREISSMANWLRRTSPFRDRDPLQEPAGFQVFRSGLDWRDEPGQSLLTLALFMALPVSILLIGCVNVLSLQLARALEYSGELSVRLALGASRATLMRLMLVEVAMLSALSGLVGWIGARVLLGRASAYMPTDVAVDERVFAFGIGLVVAVVASAGVVPAWLASRDVVAAGLRSLGDNTPARTRVRGMLLIVQVAASVALLGLSGLVTRSLINRSPSLPRHASEVLLVDINLANVRSTEPRPAVFAAAVLDMLHRDAAIRDAAFATFAVAGHTLFYALPTDAPGVRRGVSGGFVTSRWFDATGARFLAGQGFADTPGLVAPKPQGGDGRPRTQAVANAALASTLSGSPVEALGRQIRIAAGEVVEVVGIVADTQRNGNGDPVPLLFVPMPDSPPPRLTLVARTQDVSAARRSIEAAIHAVDPLVPIGRVQSLDRRMADDSRGVHELTWYGSALAILALCLSAAGLHSLLSYAARRRTREIGIRLAIGASTRTVVWGVVGPTLWNVLVGAAIGLVLAITMAHAMRGLLYGLSSFDLRALLPILALFGVVTLLACAAPVLRVSRIDPVRALREL